jgi:SAM-dependent methyltransferase
MTRQPVETLATTAGNASSCWVCGSADTRRVRASTLPADVGANSVAITDANYGATAAIYRCESCGFLQCSDFADVLGFYEDMEDPKYESTAPARALQAGKLVDLLERFCPAPARLLDVGAGIGLLVREAERRGYSATGIEPSRWLADRARARGLDVHRGVLPHSNIGGPFDAVCLIDVIEHVPDPVGLLRAIRAKTAANARIVIVTPDVGSLMARVMGRKWWHFRVAHIGYFDRVTLARACREAGLRPVHMSRPRWYFNADYLWDRVMAYVPRSMRLNAPQLLARFTIPLNLGDSMLFVAEPVPSSHEPAR